MPYTCRIFQVMDEIVYRTARGMAAEGAPFRGTLFAGLMIKDGKVGPGCRGGLWASTLGPNAFVLPAVCCRNAHVSLVLSLCQPLLVYRTGIPVTSAIPHLFSDRQTKLLERPLTC